MENLEDLFDEREHYAHAEEVGRYQARYGRAFTKSLYDPFDYALKLRTGEVIRYEHASLAGTEWAHLHQARDYPEGEEYPRGIDIRLSEVVWVKDAPQGS